MKIKTYNELIRRLTFDERYEYLKIGGAVGRATFGYERFLNQEFYHSREWRKIRNDVIVRDQGCDLAILDREIFERLIIHHLNPVTLEDIENSNDCVFDMNNLICTSISTHNAIHYGDSSLLPRLPKERTKGDTCPWL